MAEEQAAGRREMASGGIRPMQTVVNVKHVFFHRNISSACSVERDSSLF